MPWNHWHCMAKDAVGLMDRAKEFGVDGLILEFDRSPDLPLDGNQQTADDPATDELARIAKEAASRDMHVYVTVREPAAKRLAEVFDAVPALVGARLLLDEGQFSITDVAPADRLHGFLDSLLGICREKGRTLIVSTFSLMPRQMEAIRLALLRIPPDDHLVVDNYACPGDWGHIRLSNPMIGSVGGHREQISFDYCGEAWGQSVIPLCQAQFIHDTLREAGERGANIAGVSGHVTWTGNALGTPSESSVYAASKIIKGDDRPAEAILSEWAAARYGEGAAAVAASALGKTWEIVMKSWHDLGFWVHESPRSEIADIGWYNLSLHLANLAVWDASYRDTARMLQHPTEETVAAVIAEKDEATRLAEEALEEVHWTVPFRSDSDYQELRRFLEREHFMCHLLRAYSEGFYRARMFYAGDTSQEHLVCRCVHDLRHLADQVETEYDERFWICRPERVRAVARQLEEILEGAPWPMPTHEGLTADEWTERYREMGYPV